MNALHSLRRTVGPAILAILWIDVCLVLIRNLMRAGGFDMLAVAAAGMIATATTVCWMVDRTGPTTRLVSSMAHAATVAIIVFSFSGSPLQIDMHMYFFASLAICAAWIDWRPIVGYTTLVAAHHLVLYLILPFAVFPERSDLLRVFLHALILPLEGGLLVAMTLALTSSMLRAETATDEANAAQLRSDKIDALVQLLYREQRQLKQAERMANMGSYRLRLADNRAEWSDQVFAIHELPVGEMPQFETALNFYPPHARVIISTAFSQTIATGQPYDVEADFITAKGNPRRVRSIGEVEFQGDKPVAVIGVFQDITIQYRMEQALRRVATTDDLTQIPNRAQCNLVLDEQIEHARSSGERLALLLIDLDGFKMVNDLCGHLAGDELLRLIATRLKAPYLSNCFVARLGGDEFVVIISHPEDCSNLEKLVGRLLSDLRHTISDGSSVIKVSGTIGISWLDDTVINRSGLMQRADSALYGAKRSQRGTAEVYAEGGSTVTAAA